MMRFSTGAVLLTALTFSPMALADVPNDPPNTCSGEGSACDNAGTGQDESGTCTSTTVDCMSSTTCLRCFTDEQEEEAEEADGDGCAVSGPTRDGSILGAMVGLGALALLLGRRRSKS